MSHSMIEASLANNGYASSIQSTGSDRSIEYQAFAHVTQALTSVNRDAPDYFAKLFEALHKNLKLWTILSVEVANDNNELPAELRANLFYLAEFTRAHTAKVQAGKADTDVLIDINRMVMRGLRGQTVEEGAAS